MVDHLISDAMADAFDITIRREPVDIAGLVSEVADANQPLAVNKQQTITVSAPPNFVTMCDADRMREAIDNLFSNAIKYSPIGGRIAVVVTHEQNTTIIRIADEGAGLSPEDLGRLFGRFQRLSAKPTAGESSTGLGLSIIRDLKSRTNVPVIMLTATASPIDRVVGLELGADDYIAKPCELRELMARIRSVLRRSSPVRTHVATPETAAAKAAKDQLVRFGTKWLDLEAQALRDDEGNEHPLTPSAFALLKLFPANPKPLLSPDPLLACANARDAQAFDRAVDLRIMPLRRQIEP